MSHTILLIQVDTPTSRTYSDYDSVNEAMEGICVLFEEQLKRQNPQQPSITYDISQMFQWMESLADVSCLVYQKPTNTYAPYSMSWIKEKIYGLLRQQAAS